MSEIGEYFRKRMEKKLEAYQKRADEAVKTALKKAAPEVKKFEKEEYTRIYNKVIDRFYGDYAPKQYRRTYSMYNMLEFDEGDMRVSDVNFNENKMTAWRNGHRNRFAPGDDNAFMTVFIEGYHGGAKSGDETVLSSETVLNTPHPNSGTPYWRTGKRYLKWGREAARSPSPYKQIDEKMAAAESGNGSIYRGRNAIRTRYVQDELRNIFGDSIRIQS